VFYKIISLFGFSYFKTTASKYRHNLIKHNYRNQIKKNEMGEHVAHLGEKRGAYRVLAGKHKEKANLEDLGVDGRIILKRIFKK